MSFVFCILLALFQPGPPERITFSSAEGTYAILAFAVEESPGSAPGATALEVALDGRVDQIVVLTPGSGRRSYQALLGPLPAGSHHLQLRPSTLWKWDGSVRVSNPAVNVVPPGDARVETLRHAPAIGLRPDTIGTASDLPLMMYVETVREGASRWLKYSVIFSHEDGGTPGVALMARWGRTTDIELAYEVEIVDGRVIRGRYQGPDHRVMAKDRMDAAPPVLLVSTLNNMFLDRGHSSAVVRLVPEPVDLSSRSRESVMDDRPWIHRVMAHELAAERPAGVGDPRDYVYVDLKLENRGAGIALGIRSADGMTRWSDRGRSDLVVSRSGEVRIAIPSPAADRVQALSARCDPRTDAAAPAAPAPELPRCTIDIRKAFRLDRNHEPGESLIPATRLTIEAGTAREILTKIGG